MWNYYIIILLLYEENKMLYGILIIIIIDTKLDSYKPQITNILFQMEFYLNELFLSENKKLKDIKDINQELIIIYTVLKRINDYLNDNNSSILIQNLLLKLLNSSYLIKCANYEYSQYQIDVSNNKKIPSKEDTITLSDVINNLIISLKRTDSINLSKIINQLIQKQEILKLYNKSETTDNEQSKLLFELIHYLSLSIFVSNLDSIIKQENKKEKVEMKLIVDKKRVNNPYYWAMFLNNEDDNNDNNDIVINTSVKDNNNNKWEIIVYSAILFTYKKIHQSINFKLKLELQTIFESKIQLWMNFNQYFKQWIFCFNFILDEKELNMFLLFNEINYERDEKLLLFIVDNLINYFLKMTPNSTGEDAFSHFKEIKTDLVLNYIPKIAKIISQLILKLDQFNQNQKFKLFFLDR
ncbi:hypothetical protein K502DRAFT_331546 [Neoconidiobolus thromboides FSU 785]|nr:hypothetical protein K502DRAFT_331546 [Neoconidiobolus thromboides FSU 785]